MARTYNWITPNAVNMLVCFVFFWYQLSVEVEKKVVNIKTYQAARQLCLFNPSTLDLDRSTGAVTRDQFTCVLSKKVTVFL